LKILFLANRIPYPPYRGDKLKIFNLAKRLSERHELHLLTFVQTREEFKYKSELEQLFAKVHLVYLPKWFSALKCITAAWNDHPLQLLYFRSAAMRRKLKHVLSVDSFDVVHVQHLRMSPYMEARKDIPRILDMPDAFSLYWQRRKSVQKGRLQRLFESVEQTRVSKAERIMGEYDLSLVCSPEDLEYLKKEHSISNIDLLPNGVDLDIFKAGGHDYSHNHTILFTGNMDYAPNVDAACYFVEEILPLVHRKHPQAKFVIAGQRPVKKVQALASEKVIVTGFIKDLAKVYNDASIVVAPLRFGAGTQNKVLEGMAMGVPVVCSEIGFKGLGIKNGEGALMRSGTDSFAEAVIDLLQSPAKRQEVGKKGTEVMQSNFGWDAIANKLETYFEQIKRTEK
jgi:sugar transferase (PEP-CTERM/EpsH1 system associated)